MIYLAVPYSHPSPEMRFQRFASVNRYAAILMQAGHAVFSPISHSHPIEDHFDVDKQGWEFWQRQDLPILKICTEVRVLCLPGWEQSVGVAGEIAEADKLGIPVKFIDAKRGLLGDAA